MAGEGGGAGAVAPGQVVGGGVAVAGGGGARCQRVGSSARCKVATCRCFPCERVRGRAPPRSTELFHLRHCPFCSIIAV